MLSEHPDSIEPFRQMSLLNNLAYILLDRLDRSEDQALVYARQALSLAPDNMPAYNLSLIQDTLGLALIKNGMPDEAIRVLLESKENGRYLANLLHLGQAYLEAGDNNNAVLTLGEAIRLPRVEGEDELFEEATQLHTLARERTDEAR